MPTDSDLIRLYSTRILALAADMPRTVRLPQPTGTGLKRSPLCGSTITVDVAVQDGVIRDYGQEVRACALGQAAASVVGSVIIGLTEAEVQRGRDQLWAMLTENGPEPTAPFDGLAVLGAARDYRNRHGSIMLAFDATLAALAASRSAASA